MALLGGIDNRNKNYYYNKTLYNKEFVLGLCMGFSLTGRDREG